MEYFGKEFRNLREGDYEELQTLEHQGCIYGQVWRDDLQEWGYCRIKFEPKELVVYVEAMESFDEFRGYKEEGLTEEKALQRITNSKIKRRVEEYNEWAQDSQAKPFCLAAFLGSKLETLVVGQKPDRCEFLQETYTGDRRFLLREIIEGVSESINYLEDRSGDRPSYEIRDEVDFQDILYCLMKPIFPDARFEEWTPKHGGSSKRIDFVIPEISHAIEAKCVRDERHARKVGDELRVDIESYHNHPHCNNLVGVVWDEESLIEDKSNFESDLAGPREKDGKEIHVEVYVLP